MKSTSIWRVMTPIKDRYGAARWVRALIVAQHEKDAIRLAEQDALAFGYSFSGDIEVQHVANAITEDG